MTLLGSCTQGRAQQPLNPGNLCYHYDPARAERVGHYLIVWSKQCREELEIVWNNIKAEARTLADCEPMLASFTTRRYSSTKTLAVH